MVDAAHFHHVLTPPDECAAHGRGFMLTCPPTPPFALFMGDGRRALTPARSRWRHHWICMACCLQGGAAPIRAVVAEIS